MKKNLMACAISTFVLYAGCAYAQDAPKAEVMHWWTSGGEAAAVRELAAQFEKAGGIWIDSAVADSNNALASEISRVIGGDPPVAMQMPLGPQAYDLAEQGLLANLDDLATEENFNKNFAPDFLNGITYKGHVYELPINNHGNNWLWYNPQVLAKAGASVPHTWDQFFAAADKVKAAGFIPVAIGLQSWQIGQTFNSVMLSKGGRDLYLKLYKEHDASAARTPEFMESVKTFLRLRDYIDDGANNRDWNIATNLVITGKAGFQFMGDWAKGEFSNAGMTAGKDYGCVLLGENGHYNFITGGDTFVFPLTKDPQRLKAQKLLAKVLADPETQVLFSLKKGSLPARLDADTSKLDVCANIGAKAMADVNRQAPNIDMVVSADGLGATRDLAAQFWANKSMTPEQYVESFEKIIENESHN